jgi:general secretion pathway protein G
MKHSPASLRSQTTRATKRGFATFQVLVVLLLAAIAIGVSYIALRESPGARVLREADRIVTAQEENSPERLRQTAANLDTTNLLSAVRLYKLDNKQYPTQAEGLRVLTASPKPYLERLPDDPWGRPYQYLNPGKRGEIEVLSSGPDGLAGTEDDIGSWQVR